MHQNTVTLDAIVSLAKRRGFIYPSAEIYGGLNGVYDFGHLGSLLKQNIRAAWLKAINAAVPDGQIVNFEGPILGPEPVWQASGHVQHFHDPMVDCLQCKHRFRADDIDLNKPCSNCGNKNWTAVRQFNMMFKTFVGAVEDASSIAYLRPETAQAIFINFKNVYSTARVKMPFGIAQIGKAFRNEITPKQFLFRMREFEQMEIEWFCKPDDAMGFYEHWCAKRMEFYQTIGLTNTRLRPHDPSELAHYSKGTADVEYLFPFGWKELEGIAYRGDFDLTQHMQRSGKDLSVFDEQTKQSYVPHVVECSVGADRLLLALLCSAYTEDVVDGEKRVMLKLHPKLAPYTAAFFPLTGKQEAAMRAIYERIKSHGYSVQLDESGSIGKRYRRQDEIGTPVCFTYDFESDTDGSVTVRSRDTMQQERIGIDKIEPYLASLVKS
jgi:glycyl-tRNA synthetase